MKICNPVKLLVGTLVVAGTGFAGTAFGGVNALCFTNSMSYQPTDWNGSSISLPQFDPSLGQLQSVTISLDSGLTTTLGITNRSSSSSLGQAKTILSLDFKNASLGGNVLDGKDGSLSLNYSSAQYCYSLGAGSALTTGALSGESGWAQSVVTDPTILAGFEGRGKLNFLANTTTYTSIFNSGGNTAAAQHTSANLTSVVTYSYVPGAPVAAPEPGSLALLGLGALVLGWRRVVR
jgi:PEP-CTERM motif